MYPEQRRKYTPRAHHLFRLLPKGACMYHYRYWLFRTAERPDSSYHTPLSLDVSFLKNNPCLIDCFIFFSTANLQHFLFPRSCFRATLLAEPSGPVISRRKAFTLSRYVSVRSMCVSNPVSAYSANSTLPPVCVERGILKVVYAYILQSITLMWYLSDTSARERWSRMKHFFLSFFPVHDCEVQGTLLAEIGYIGLGKGFVCVC